MFVEHVVPEHVPIGNVGVHWDKEFNVVETKFTDVASPFPVLQTLEIVCTILLLKEVGHELYVVVIKGWAFKLTQTFDVYWFENEGRLGKIVTTVTVALLQTVFVQKL